MRPPIYIQIFRSVWFHWSYCLIILGEEHNIKFATCACEPLVLTMIRARLWPSSPQRPHLAFMFELLDWAEALLLEGQVFLNDFCKVLYFKCQHLMVKVNLAICVRSNLSLHILFITMSTLAY